MIEITLHPRTGRDDQIVTYRRWRLTLPAHGAIEFASGLAMMLAPAVIGFGTAALLLSVLLGAVAAGMGLALTAGQDRAAAWHSQYDAVFGLATALAALLLALAGQGSAGIFLAAVAALQATLSFATRDVLAA